MAPKGRDDASGDERGKRRVQAWERDLRLWSGLALLAFLTSHLLNHAVGIFGLDAMELAQAWMDLIWQSVPGEILLYGGGAVHIVLTLKRISARRTLRMPRDEMMQIVLGLTIPVLLIDHVVGTRLLAAVFDEASSYSVILPRLYNFRPYLQTALVLIAWTHGAIGFHHAFRWRNWYKRCWLAFLLLAVMIPLLSLAGFVAGSREVELLQAGGRPPSPEIRAWLALASQRLHLAFAAALAATGVVIALRALRRRRSGFFTIRYTGHGALKMSRGTSILEASRINGIPHPSRCGGRARCATCRVLVVQSDEPLPPPGKAERALLTRIDAPAQVRLGCQLRPSADISVQILLPFLASPDSPDPETDEFRWGVQHVISVLFVNIRGSNLMAQRQHPQDLVLLLNRFSAEMTQAVEAHGGRVTANLTDGLMAIFGPDRTANDTGAARAVAAAQDMLKATRSLDSELADVLAFPLRIGIGIHTGPAVIARFGDKQRGQTVGALGETVSLAARLERATKGALTDCLISAETLKAAGGRIETSAAREISIPGRDAPLTAHALKEAAAEYAALTSADGSQKERRAELPVTRS